MIKDAKSIAEYKIRKWIWEEIPYIKIISFEMDGNEATIMDEAGSKLTLVYDEFRKKIYEKE